MAENERLTIDEIIQHCNRTCENTEMLAIARGQNQEDITSKAYWEHYQIANYLEELKQYRAIGTIEECKNAVNLIRPRKPYKGSFGVLLCSLCGEKVGQAVTKKNKADCMNFCANCGSLIDWSEW